MVEKFLGKTCDGQCHANFSPTVKLLQGVIIAIGVVEFFVSDFLMNVYCVGHVLTLREALVVLSDA